MSLPAAPVAPGRGRLLALGQTLALPLLLLVIWQLWAATLPSNTQAPSPARVVGAFATLTASGDLPWSTLQSLGRVLVGFAIALVLGTTLGVAMGMSRKVRANLDPIVEGFRPIAPMAILPIAILWLGTGTPAAFAIVAYAAFFPVLIQVFLGIFL